MCINCCVEGCLKRAAFLHGALPGTVSWRESTRRQLEGHAGSYSDNLEEDSRMNEQ